MNNRAVHWLIATGMALVLHGLLLTALFKETPPSIEIAGGRIEVTFGNAGGDTADATAEQGVETTAADPEDPESVSNPTSTPNPEQPVEKPETPETVTDAPEPIPEAEADPEPERPEIAAPQEVSDTADTDLSKRQSERPDTPVRQSEARPATDKLSPRPEESVDTTSRSASQNGAALKGDDSTAATSSGSLSGDTDAQNTNSEVGSSAASNYPGQIVRMLSRKRLPASVPKGSALVSFSIERDGDVLSAEIAETSGSTRFDRAAVRLIKAAAPFPPPPPGAMLDYTVVIKKD
ncbi:MAG: TonB family protein [Pseudomonadota bacterium]